MFRRLTYLGLECAKKCSVSNLDAGRNDVLCKLNAVRTFMSRNNVAHIQERVGVIGAPIEKGQMRTGVGKGPQVIREGGLKRKMLEIGCDFKDYGDVSVRSIKDDTEVLNAQYPRTFHKNSLSLSEAVENILLDDRTALVLGGDHSLAVGSILGHARVNPDLCVIWVDAHADINTPLNSLSGNMHGMPLAFLIHEVQEDVPWIDEFEDIRPCLSARNVVYLGLRDVDPFERYILDKHRIANYTMHDIDRRGMFNVVSEAIQLVNPGLRKPIHVSFDIDALDPLYARSTGTAVSGGLTLRDALLFCEEVHNTGERLWQRETPRKI